MKRPRARKAQVRMGRSYWFECARCGYRAKVSGRSDRGINVCVETIVCRDCKELYDAVVRLKVPAGTSVNANGSRFGSANAWVAGKHPPTFLAALNRLTVNGGRPFKWVQFPLQCPVIPFHRVQAWSDPDRCPRCGIYLDKNVLPFRIWD